MRFDSLKEAVDVLGASSSVASLFVPQAFFGAPAGVASSGRVVERFRMREARFQTGSHEASGRLVGKSIIRKSLFRHMHTAHTADTYGVNVVVSDRDLRINHYYCRSRKEQQEREKSGAAWISKLSHNWEGLCEKLYIETEDNDLFEKYKGVII